MFVIRDDSVQRVPAITLKYNCLDLSKQYNIVFAGQ